MDYAKGRDTTANRPPEYVPENPGQDRRADLAKEAYCGQAMRRLESDMGLPGYLCGKGSARREERSVPAPFYPQEEARPNPRPGTIPVMPRQAEPPQSYAPPRESYPPQPAYVDPNQNYIPERQYPPPSVRPGCNDGCQPQQYIDPRGYRDTRRYSQDLSIEQQEQQYIAMKQAAQQQRYATQQSMINGDIFFNSQRQINRQQYQQFREPGDAYKQQWWQETNYPMNPNQRYQPSRNPELDSYRQQWWQQSQQPNNQRYYPGRNPQLDNSREQWWNRSQYPNDSRYTPGRNPELNDYRNQWWQNAQTRPGSVYRPVPIPSYPVPIEEYPPQSYPQDDRNYPQDYPQNPNQNDRSDTVRLQEMGRAIDSVLGRSVEEYDRSVPARLGCVRAVSLVLERTYGLPIRDQNCDRIKETLRDYGWVSVDPSQIQPGDVIVGDRQPGQHGHAAIYVGNDQIFNNDSNSGKMQIDSLGKFRTGEFVSIKVYRKAR